MASWIRRAGEALDRPIGGKARLVLLAVVFLLGLSFLQPLWRIAMVAPQYPNGLSVDIYLYKVEGGRDGRDISEINSLNHYIGMAPINREQLGDLDWMPFAFLFLILVTLRVAVIGNGRDLVDLSFLVTFVTATALARFAFKLYVLGHTLDPKAPFQVEPFMPVVMGMKQVANFTTWAYPLAAAGLIGLSILCVFLTTAHHLLRGTYARDADSGSR